MAGERAMSLIYETSLFLVEAAEHPHVCRTDGGHAVIYPTSPVVNRWDFEPERAKALMRLSMMAGEAMTAALNDRGIAVERINFQDNGNWGIGTPGGPHFHLHLYGRARGSVHQTHGEALYFPHKALRFWDALEPLNDDDCLAIRNQLERLGRQERYRPERWA